jgi:outer membrane protein assembly factor BamB
MVEMPTKRADVHQWLLAFKEIKENWLDEVKGERTGSERTGFMYLDMIEPFIRFMDMTPSEIIAKGTEEIKKSAESGLERKTWADRTALAFFNWVQTQKTKRGKTTWTRANAKTAYGVARSFLRYNGFTFKGKTPIAPIQQSVKLPSNEQLTEAWKTATVAQKLACGLLRSTMWLSMPPPTLLELGPSFTQGWHGFTVTVTKPGGTTETLGPFNTESTGSTYTSYNPSVVGTYKFKLNFPGETKNGTVMMTGQHIDNYFKPSSTAEVTVTVQEEPLAPYPDWPLPTDYWSRPIESENRLWGAISGNWLLERYSSDGNLYIPYTKAPNTAHIVWTRELAFGGVTGGEFGDESYHEGHVYTDRFKPPVIIDGRLYYNQPDTPKQGFYCVDLQTGEQIFYSNMSSNPTGGAIFWSSNGGTGGISCGEIVNVDTINMHGTHAFLWSLSAAAYALYDPFTGNAILTFKNVDPNAGYYPAIRYDEKGNMLVYVLDGAHGWLAMWNSTLALYPEYLPGMTDRYGLNFSPIPGTYDWSGGVQWNVTMPAVGGLLGWMTDNPGPAAVNDEALLTTTWNFFAGAEDGKITDVAFSPTDGHVLWTQIRTVTPGATSFAAKGPAAEGVYCRYVKETKQWYAYDIKTGAQKWGPTEAYTSDWGMYQQAGATAAYGKLYASAYDGMIHAYDIKTGEHLWDFWTGNAGYETPYGTWPFYGLSSGVTVADGKIYTGSGEHSADVPLWRGGGLYCVNATTGDLIWKIKGWYWTPIIADGYMVVNNGATNSIYCFGKGKTTTTVSAPDTDVTVGQNVVIKGTVTDESPGAKGTPAIADAYQSEWMEYLYMQKPKPANATGVTVTLDVLDSNNNYRNIGTATSDANGFYSFAWKPDIPGKYIVYARFIGSESYWQSNAETAFFAEDVPAATPEPTQAPASLADQYMLPGIGITVAAIAIVGAIIVLMLRKR